MRGPSSSHPKLGHFEMSFSPGKWEINQRQTQCDNQKETFRIRQLHTTKRQQIATFLPDVGLFFVVVGQRDVVSLNSRRTWNAAAAAAMQLFLCIEMMWRLYKIIHTIRSCFHSNPMKNKGKFKSLFNSDQVQEMMTSSTAFVADPMSGKRKHLFSFFK